MSLMMVRAKVKPESVGEVEAAAKAMFAAIDAAGPEGVRYVSSKLADGTTYVIFLALEDGIGNPLTAVPEFLEFQRNLGGWLAEPSVPEQLTVVGSYRF